MIPIVPDVVPDVVPEVVSKVVVVPPAVPPRPVDALRLTRGDAGIAEQLLVREVRLHVDLASDQSGRRLDRRRCTRCCPAHG